jgi:hypothetical protein
MAVTVAQLIDAAKLQADKRNDQTIADADWCTIANWSVMSLWRRVSAIDPDWYFDQQDFTLAGGASGATKDLSTLTGSGGHSFAALHGIDLNPDTTQRSTVPRLNFAERNAGRFSRWVPTVNTINRSYDVRGNNLVITPYEAAAGTYRVYYRYQPYQFTGPTDTTTLEFQLAPYAEYLSIRMAMRGLKIEESDANPLAQDLADLWAEIRAEHSRDDEAPAIIADVEGTDWPWGGRY